MKVEIKKLPKSEIELNIVVPVEEWNEFINEASQELSRDLKIEGFRPGHAPQNMVEARVGSAKILEEAAEHCVRHLYVRAITDNNIEAVGRPEISVLKIAKDNPFEFKARAAVLPEVVLPDYKKIAQDLKKEKKEVEVSDEEIAKSIEWLKKSRAKYITVPRVCQIGDRVEIDFEGFCEGQALKELVSKNHPTILGRGYFIPGFEENLVGMKEGEEKQFNIKFPEDFEHKHLAGKSVEFKTKMNLVQEAELPEINDEFAKNLGDFADLAALRQSVKGGLLKEKEEQEKDRWRTKLIEEIAKKSKMEIPEILIEGEKDRMSEELKARIGQVGLILEEYLDKFKKTEAEILSELAPKAQERVRSFLILQEIAKQEKIEVSDEEIEREVNYALTRYKSAEHAQNQQVDIEQLKAYTKDILKNQKVFQILEN
ncbi:MAG: trigger factor [Candidatus Portnoybacteria bacterium RBG_13_41_18]|uniref:Trigger factor n=1 Tax=Candidatus Portnoybacteria bacterium RBG_13_41_18 TaxID=1801991 RepID=A0A1G2F769_9BACT|nr:MAG: trigger factor [Candidatus Portnoybacteria bacterium RBG_13_41_18]